ncbi:MAG TPA: asparagine synthase (glutamine-hydrolyzing) [Vicinamibacterales bacterium]|nr:asparagine synthase (glutamine-hydrolyzing) [Vicinamibacterales bacterium]
MCGIAGLVALDGVLAPDVAVAIRPMTAALAHRGPDGDGFVFKPGAALGHRRLAIIDVARGAQPMSNEDGTRWIVFNGEIYNHRPLRERLIGLGHTFRTHADTETIVHAYEQFGPACVELLAGMFAFAIYDQRTGELFIARDRLGKKPLFYTVIDGVLHFASETKALFESPLWTPDVDLGQIETYLSLGYFLAPGTPYRGVKKLEPGHWLLLRRGTVTTRKYWDVERFDDFAGDEPAALAAIEEQLAERVRERLESEVPLGAFLSGGIDSGLVVSYMAEAMDRPVVTTTVGFGEAAHNEIREASLTAACWSTAHHTHVIRPELDDVFDRIVGAYDEPFADSSSIPTFYVAREARRHVTVALTGDGGDETFGGYDFRYVPHAVEDRIRRRLPGPAARRALRALGARWPRSRRLPRLLRLGTFLENLGWEAQDAYFSDLCFLEPAIARQLMGRAPDRDPRTSAAYETVTAAYRACQSPHPVQRAQYADLKIYLPNDVLVKVDRMSMQHGLEVRSPLLDHRLVELAFRLPQRLKRADRTGKHLLRQVARRRLPPAVLGMRKHGFSAPIGEWIAGEYAARFEDQVLGAGASTSGWIDQSIVRALFRQHRRGERNHAFALWAVWVLEAWARRQTAPRRQVLAAG